MEESRWIFSLLLDFYGKLLTDKQRQCCELYYNEDLSLSEIAEQSGISRQGVWDNIRRGSAALRETEEKTGLIGRFDCQRQALEKLREKTELLCRMTEGPARELAEELLSGITERIESHGI